MNKQFFLGDSGIKNSALQAYRAAYKNAIQESYELIREKALKILRHYYGVVFQELEPALVKPMLLDRHTQIQTLVRQNISVDHFYYEQGQNTASRSFRCFMSASLAEGQIQNLARRLAKYYYQYLYFVLSPNQEQVR